MPLNRDAIEHIAHLARLDIKDIKNSQDLDAIQADLNRIVSMVDQITAANTDGIQPMAHPLKMVQRLRPDTVTEPNDRDTLLALAPLSEAGLFLVPTVLEDA
jgi:aspartyl-tRNA(Asn)/glutamyl-tRNA(Gln) amidotransferase subunit C